MPKLNTLLSNLRECRDSGEQITLHTDTSDYRNAIVTRITRSEIHFVHPQFSRLFKTILHLDAVIGVSRVIATLDIPDDDEDEYIELY